MKNAPKMTLLVSCNLVHWVKIAEDGKIYVCDRTANIGGEAADRK